jgi:antitoxin VapB
MFEGAILAKAQVVNSRNGQVIRLPKEIHIKTEEVEVFRRGNEIILREKMTPMQKAFQLIAELDFADALKDRHRDRPQKRKGL